MWAIGRTETSARNIVRLCVKSQTNADVVFPSQRKPKIAYWAGTMLNKMYCCVVVGTVCGYWHTDCCHGSFGSKRIKPVPCAVHRRALCRTVSCAAQYRRWHSGDIYSNICHNRTVHSVGTHTHTHTYIYICVCGIYIYIYIYEGTKVR